MGGKEILLLHVPQIYDERDGKVIFTIAVMPMGFFSMASELQKAGYGVEMVNLLAERMQSGNFLIQNYLCEEEFLMVGMSLHWVQQTKDVLLVAEALKAANPKVFLFFGGYTASCFAEEILQKYSFVDGVIKGEGEIPVRKLADVLLGKQGSLADVPNLCWRRQDGSIAVNAAHWVASREELDGFDFVHSICCLKNAETYLIMPPYTFLTNKGFSVSAEKLFIHCLGRGCIGNCTWCGGGYRAGKALMGRSKLALRSPGKVAEEMFWLYENYGVGKFYICYDPFPHTQGQPVDICRLLGAKYPKKIAWEFECFALPKEEFLRAVKENLSENSCLIISPDFALEKYRLQHKAFFYSNKEFWAVLDKMSALKIKAHLYFAILPYDPPDEQEARRVMIKKIKAQYGELFRVFVQNMPGIDPLSPSSFNPKVVGICWQPKTLMDYYRASLC